MESLVHALLCNALVATGLALIPMALNRAGKSPALVHAFWLIVLIKLVTPPIVPISLTIPSGASYLVAESPKPVAAPPPLAPPVLTPAVDAPVDETGEALRQQPETEIPGRFDRNIDESFREGETVATASSLPNWESLALAVMLAGGAVVWSLAAFRIARVQRFLSRLDCSAHREIQDRVNALACRLELDCPPAVTLVPGRVPPMLWALGGRTRLLLPVDFWSQLDESQQTALLAHELAHLKRKDHWVRWLDLAVTGLYWWLPVVWMARRGLRDAEELCCDAWAVWAVPRGARVYASTLLAALDFIAGASTEDAAPSLAMINGKGKRHFHFLNRRISMIVQSTTPRGLSWAGRIGLLGLAALVLPMAPRWGRAEDDSRTVANEAAAVGQDSTLPDRIALNLVEPGSGEAAPINVLDDDDDVPGEVKEHADHLERVLKDLADRLGKDLGPVAQEVSKALEAAAKEVSEAIDKDGVISKDLRQALEKARDQLQESFKSGGPLDQQARESAEKAREDMKEAVDKARQELHDAVKERADKVREEVRERADKVREEVRERAEKARDTAREQAEKAREAAARRGLLSDRENEDKVAEEAPPSEAEAAGSVDLDQARREVRLMQQQLRRAAQRLESLERRERLSRAGRRGEGRARGPVPPVPPRPPVPPAPPETPTPPQEPGEHRAPVGPGPGPRGPVGPSSLNPRAERRLRELESKMDRLLKELESLKGDKKEE